MASFSEDRADRVSTRKQAWEFKPNVAATGRLSPSLHSVKGSIILGGVRCSYRSPKQSLVERAATMGRGRPRTSVGDGSTKLFTARVWVNHAPDADDGDGHKGCDKQSPFPSAISSRHRAPIAGWTQRPN